MDEQRLSTRRMLSIGLLCLLSGCAALGKWPGRHQPCALQPGITQEQLVAHLNRNIVGSDTHSGLVSWRTMNSSVTVSGIPFAAPTSIAVEAPRNLRIVVANPATRGQEVDIGSNEERFWIWFKQAPGIITSKHEDIGAALTYMQMPIQIHPDWLMEVLGVIPINSSEYKMLRSDVGEAELVSLRKTPTGETIERSIKVNICRGVITEHCLRQPGGPIIARAVLNKHHENPQGITLPMEIQLQWPSTKQTLTIHLKNPELNPASLASNQQLWQIPHIPGTQIVDVGAQAREALGTTAAAPMPLSPPVRTQSNPFEPPGRVHLAPSAQLDAPAPWQRPMPVLYESQQ